MEQLESLVAVLVLRGNVRSFEIFELTAHFIAILLSLFVVILLEHDHVLVVLLLLSLKLVDRVFQLLIDSIDFFFGVLF